MKMPYTYAQRLFWVLFEETWLEQELSCVIIHTLHIYLCPENTSQGVFDLSTLVSR